MDWVIEEMCRLSLGDKRLEKRAQKVLRQLSNQTSESIPSACGGWAETKAAYRLFDNERVSAEKIQETHYKATLKRMSEQRIVLIPQDTTVLNFVGQTERKDAGPTSRDSTHGIYLHCAIAVTPEKICLGSIGVKQWHRNELQKLSKIEKKEKNYARKLEEKESYRWLENYRQANEYAKALPDTVIVSIADREGDIYDIYEEAYRGLGEKERKAHYLIRAKTDRKVCDEEGRKNKEKIKSELRGKGALGEIQVEVSETKKRKTRQAQMQVYAKSMYISLPERQKRDENYKPVKITAILCSEETPPSDTDPIEWLLITDLPSETFEDACEKIEWYVCRWQIEIFFKILKSGCTIEKLQLTDKNFSVCLSFYMIIAWRILYAVIMGRQSPDISCECIFSEEEWRTTYVVAYRKKPPEVAPTLNEMVRMVACLGGYLNRKSDPPPGVKTMWLGLRNMQEHLRAKEAFDEVFGLSYG